VEVAAGGSGGDPVSTKAGRLDLVLYVLAVVLACGCIVGGVLAVRHKHQLDAVDPATVAPDTSQAERYGQVMTAADATATAMVNIDYRDPRSTYQAVAATATGTFLQQYQKSYRALVKLVTQYKSVETGHVISTAVSSVDPDSATVLVSTTGRVQNVQSGTQQVVRNYRLVLDLQLVDGVWKTSDLEFSG
jgi:Mce-associated membrane protein